jgi:hypothetical protein
VGSQSGRRSTGRGATIEGAVRVNDVLLDTGSDVTIVSKGVLDALASAGVAVDEPHRVYPYGTYTKPLDMYRMVKYGGVTLETTCGPLVLRRLQAWVDDSAPHVELIISRQVMVLLGFSTDDLLVGALQKRVEWDVPGEVDASPQSGMARVQRLMVEKLLPQDPVLEDNGGLECAIPEVYSPKKSGSDEELVAIHMAKVKEAQDACLSEDDVEALRALLLKHVDVYRIDLGYDPPVKVEPLKVRTKPGSTPVKCGMRRYPLQHVEYMCEHVAAFEANDMVYLNNRATWSSAPRIVSKK